MNKNHVSFLDAIKMFGRVGEVGGLMGDVEELADFLERESVAFKTVKMGYTLYWIDTGLEGKEDVYSVRYTLLWRDGKYEAHNPYCVFNCTAYKEWRQEHGARQKYC